MLWRKRVSPGRSSSSMMLCTVPSSLSSRSSHFLPVGCQRQSSPSNSSRIVGRTSPRVSSERRRRAVSRSSRVTWNSRLRANFSSSNSSTGSSSSKCSSGSGSSSEPRALKPGQAGNHPFIARLCPTRYTARMVTQGMGAAHEPDWVREVLAFWFGELGPRQWFSSSDELDARIRTRFGALHAQLLATQAAGIEGLRATQAAVIVLDQFSRNLYRNDARAFAGDASARRLARALVDAGADVPLPPEQRMFLYLPFEHSEAL